RKPHELSGGEQQRIGVIRALAADPDIILMDEPFSALDPLSREKLQNDMKDLHKKINKTIVFVTHDIQEAFKLADRVCIMKKGEMVQVGTPEEISSQPANDFVQDFVGSTKQVGANFDISHYLQQIEEIKTISVLPDDAKLDQILEKLSLEEEIAIEKEGKMIGIINRQQMVRYFSTSLKEGRKEYV